MRNPAILVGLPALLLAGCASRHAAPARGLAPTPTEAQVQPAPAAITIGLVLPLSGRDEPFGRWVQYGTILAVEEQNTHGGIGGRPISLETADTGSKRAQVTVVAARLLEEKRPLVLLGEASSFPTLALSQLAEAHRVPLVTAVSTYPAVTWDGGRVRSHVFRACFIDPYQGRLMARFARERLKLDRIAVLWDPGTQYVRSVAEEFRARFEDLGGTVPVAAEYRSGDTDFGSPLGAIRSASVDAVYAPGFYPDVAAAARQARALGIRVPFLGADGWDSVQLLARAGEALEGSYFTNHASLDDPRPEVSSFRERHLTRFGEEPNVLSVLAYDAARMTFAALERAPELTRADVRDALEQTRDFPAVSGLTTLDRRHDAVKPVVVMRIERGEFVYFATIGRDEESQPLTDSAAQDR